ncbi:MAG: radical SAM protein [Desulfobacterales bacterium]
MAICVNEIFYSIQGESIHAGRPCVFIRVAGCNLRCSYCDTRYAYEDGRILDIAGIMEAIRGFNCRLVEVTGGEPLLQQDVLPLISTLASEGYETMLETNGTLAIEAVDERCMKIVDIKCPGSNESGRFNRNNLACLGPQDQIKFVLKDRTDYEFAAKWLPEIPACVPRRHVLFSPVFGVLDPAELSAWILGDHLPVRVHLQLHKAIWPKLDRGV